jgi:imidazolonepropionase-like amidohydrolase
VNLRPLVISLLAAAALAPGCSVKRAETDDGHLLAPLTPPAEDGELLLTNARILDPGRRSREDGHLLIRDGRIAAILRELPPQFRGRRVDLGNRWVIPGLFDAHTHAFGNPAPGAKLEFLGVAGSSARMQQAGVTGFLDLFSDEGEIFAERARQRARPAAGARIFAAGPCLTSPGGHCTEYAPPTRIVDSPAGAAAEVRELAKRHPDVVKLVYGHGFPGRYTTMSRDTMVALIAAAHAHGLRTVVHIETWQDVAEVVEAGADAVTHTPAGTMPEELITRMRERGVLWIPTMTVESELLDLVEHPERLDEPFLAQLVAPAILDAYRAIDENDPAVAFFLEFQRNQAATLADNVRRAAAGGVAIAAGTDVGNLATFVGYSLHREIELLVQAGLDPWDALRAATVVPATFLGGRADLAAGAPANLLVLDGSPLADIRQTRRPVAVLQDGQFIQPGSSAPAGR